MNALTLLLALLGLIIGGATGFAVRKVFLTKKDREVADATERMINEATMKAKEMVMEAKTESIKMQEEVKREEKTKHEQLQKMEERLTKKEEALDKKMDETEKAKTDLEQKITSVKTIREEVEKVYNAQAQQLQKIAALTPEQAKEMLLKQVEEESKEDLLAQIEKSEKELKEKAQEKARYLIADAIQRVAADVTSESTTTIVNLPSDDLKGRIIGREGRNINTFEQITGIDVIVDDTPGSIVISGFDMIRRYIAKMTLERLIVDGRIHPARIEETYEKVKEDVNNLIKEIGEKAVFDTGVTGLHPNLVKLLGRLKFRLSYGQNVLKHSMEVAFIAGALAAELGADVNVCKKAGLLHDIGKAVDHEIQGNHVKIGAEIAKKFGLTPDIVHAIEAHDGNIEAKSVEAMLVEAANLIANGRPGATKENLDTFVRRMQELENLCTSFAGVKKAYALQAGNEVRIFVNADDLDDLGSKRLSHDVARKIERDFQHPNPIKVNVIREVRREATAD